jgi:hypothetical protein
MNYDFKLHSLLKFWTYIVLQVFIVITFNKSITLMQSLIKEMFLKVLTI